MNSRRFAPLPRRQCGTPGWNFSWSRGQPPLPDLAAGAAVVLLDRLRPAGQHRRPADPDPGRGVDAGLQRPRPDPRRRLGRRTHRPAGPHRLAARYAGHRPQGTTPSRRQRRITDADGRRVTAFATNSTRGQLPNLELRHRRHARAGDRIHCAKDTGLTSLPLHNFAQTRSGAPSSPWRVSYRLDADARLHRLRRSTIGTPKRLRTRLFTVPGPLTRTARQQNAAPGRAPPVSCRPPAPRPDRRTGAGTRLTQPSPSRRPARPPDVEPEPTRATSGKPSYPAPRITPSGPASRLPMITGSPTKDSG